MSVILRHIKNDLDKDPPKQNAKRNFPDGTKEDRKYKPVSWKGRITV